LLLHATKSQAHATAAADLLCQVIKLPAWSVGYLLLLFVAVE
jgi:hypothetical protein